MGTPGLKEHIRKDPEKPDIALPVGEFPHAPAQRKAFPVLTSFALVCHQISTMELIFIPAPNLNREATVSENEREREKRRNVHENKGQDFTPVPGCSAQHVPTAPLQVVETSSNLWGEDKLAEMARSGTPAPRFVNIDYVTAESWTVKKAEH